MKKNVHLTISVLLALLCFCSCDDEKDAFNPSTMLQMYGRQYELTNGVIWKNNPRTIYSTTTYIYEDTYINEAGKEITDNVEGFTLGDGQVELGDFMLSLYETGLVFNEDLQAVKGNGACICFHLTTSDPESLVPGKYVFGKKQQVNTFVGYSSSDFKTESTSNLTTPAEISEGEVTIEKNGELYTVVFHCKTTFGGELSGEYRGKLMQCDIPKAITNSVQNLSLAGLMDTVTTITEIWGATGNTVTKTLDWNNGAAFLSSLKGVCQKANAGEKDLVDIALVWDKNRATFYFESPIRMRSLLGHLNEYNFPCHTIYMKAPNTFTDEDYEKLDEIGFTFDVQEQKVEFSTVEFKPGYVFFKAGNGTLGVMHIKSFAPLETKENIKIVGSNFLSIFSQVNPVLKIDMKCPANFVNPSIR